MAKRITLVLLAIGSLVFAFAWASRAQETTSVAFQGYTTTFENPNTIFHPNGRVEVLDESLRGPCSPDKILEALKLADAEFVRDPNEPAIVRLNGHDWASYEDSQLTPAQLLRRQAIELERKSAAAQKIKALLKACEAVKEK